MTILFILLVIVGLAVVVGLWGVGIYNGLVTARNDSYPVAVEAARDGDSFGCGGGVPHRLQNCNL